MAEHKAALNVDFPDMPYLKHGGKVYTESSAILYAIPHLANQDALNGKDPEEIILMTQYEGVMVDLTSAIFQTLKEEGEKREEAINKLNAKFEAFNRILNGKKFLLGDHITRTDFLGYEKFKEYSMIAPEKFKALKNLVDYVHNFEQIPQIKKYIGSEQYKKVSKYILPSYMVKMNVEFF